MTMKQKLRISNILMIMIPVVTAIILMIILYREIETQYLETVEEIYEDENSMFSAESILIAYNEEIFEKNGDVVLDGGQKTIEMKKLEEQLEDFGYHFKVVINDKAFYNNMTEEDKKIENAYINANNNELKKVIIVDEGMAVIQKIFDMNGYHVKMLAVHEAAVPTKAEGLSYLRKMIAEKVLIMIVVILCTIFLCNAILSWWISRSILKPLQALQMGTKKIRSGDLESKITYSKKDEIGEVCKDFDEMRGYLKKSAEDRIRFENDRTALLAGISHDLRTPLTSIKGYVEGLLDGIANNEGMQKRYYKAIHTRTEDMEKLVDSLGMYTHLETKQYHFELQPIKFNTYMEERIKEYQLEPQQKHVMIEFVPEEEPFLIAIDDKEMQRVLQNIIGNSIKYSDKEDVILRIRTYKDSEHGYAVLEIADNGPGVAKEELPKIFECFYRGDISRTHPGNGSGMGLCIVQQIVEGHGGKIEAESKDGLVIRIRLPLLEGL